MSNKLRPSQLEVLNSGDINGNEFFALHRIGYNYSLTLGELKKYIGTGGSGGGSDIDLTSVPSNIIPDSNGSRILGNAENAWKILFLTDSIVFSGGRGSINGDLNVIGALNVKGAAVAMQSSIDRINGIVGDMDVRLLKVEQGGAVVDLSDYYTKHDADNKFVNISVLNNYVSVRGDHTITGTHTYNDGKLKVGQWAFGESSSGVTIDGHVIKTSGNSYSNSDIDNKIASISTASKLGGMLNITDKTAIQNAQKLLTSTNQVAYYIITDSSGKLPSKQTCFDLSADIIKQLSLTSPNTLTNAALSLVHGRVAVSPIGVNVGDMIAITRVKVKVDDLTATLGVSLSLSGEIEMYQYRIISFNDAKAPKNGIANGVMGLMTPSDKAEVSKIGGIEWTANHVRDNYLPKADLLPSIWGTNMNDCLSTGVYPWCTLGRPSGSTGAYTCIVKRTSTNDGSYDTIEQTAYGREGESGRVFKRIIFQHKNGSDTQYGDWIELGGGSVDLSIYATQSWVSNNFLTKMTIDSAPTTGSSNLVTSGGVLSAIAKLDEFCDTAYLKKTGGTINGSLSINGLLNIGTNYIRGNGNHDILNSQGEWVILGYGIAGAGLPTYIDGNEIYLRYGTGHTTRMKIDSSGTEIYGNLGVTGSIYGTSLVFSNTSGDGLYMSDYTINAHNKGTYTRQLLKFDPSSGKVNLVNGFYTNVTSYIGGHEILTSNSLKIGEYAFQDRTENRLSSTTDLNNVSYGVWGTIDNMTYTNAPVQNFGLIVSRLNQLYKGQLILPYGIGHLQYRAQYYNNGKIEWSEWKELVFKDDLTTIRSNAANGNTAYNWGDHSGQGYALKYNFMSFDGVLAADDKSILPYLRTSSPSYGYTSSIANMTIRYCKSSNFNSGYGAFFAFDLTALQTAAMQGNYGSVPIYYAFPNSDYYNDFNNNRTYAVAKSYKLFGNSTELYGNHTAGLYKLIHEGNIESILSGKYLGKNDTAAAAYRLESNSGSHVLYVDGNGYPTSNNILLFKNAAGSSNFGYVGRANDTGLYVMTYGSSSVIFGTNSAERFRVDHNGNILIANDKMIFFNHGNEGVYMYGTGISWHNSSNAWTKTLMTFSNNGVVAVYNSLKVGNTSLENGTSSIHVYRNGYNVPYIRFSAKNAQGVDYTCGEIGVNNATGMPVYWNTIKGSTSWKSFITEDNISDYLTDYTKNTAFESFVLSALTESNYSSYALPLSGGNITGAINTSSNITFTNTGGYHINYPGAKWSVQSTGAATFLSVSQTSDANMKNLMGDVNLSVNQIANAPARYFTWNNNIQLGRQVGTVAQYWKDVLPEVVIENEGLLGLNYASLAVVSSIILARRIETHEQRIARLEKEIATLTDELNSLVGKA